MKKGIYKFYWDCGRQGNIDGIFVATDEEIKSIIGKEIYFGEVLGKHSEIYGSMGKEDIELITDSEEVVKIFEKYKIYSGFNPLDYLEEEE
jgi:phenolic acid decarboxylase